MSKKNKRRKPQKKEEEEIIIGYNTRQRKKDKPPKKKKKSKNVWKKIKAILLTLLKIALILATIAGIGAFLFISPVFNIVEIKVENANKISNNTYISLSGLKTEENIFRINKSKIREGIKTESYVEEVEIKRELPGTVILTVQERKPEYKIEKNGGLYMYIDKNGYYLEDMTENINLPIIKGIKTDIENLTPGNRMLEEDLGKFNDLIKIVDGMKSNNIEIEPLIINISDKNTYILEFVSEGKKVILGDISNISTKMIWIKYFMTNEENKRGTIHLETDSIYFAPEE